MGNGNSSQNTVNELRFAEARAEYQVTEKWETDHGIPFSDPERGIQCSRVTARYKGETGVFFKIGSTEVEFKLIKHHRVGVSVFDNQVKIKILEAGRLICRIEPQGLASIFPESRAPMAIAVAKECECSDATEVPEDNRELERLATQEREMMDTIRQQTGRYYQTVIECLKLIKAKRDKLPFRQ